MCLPLILRKSQNISFDVFDTLIKRSVARPGDLFLIMEQYCANEGMAIPGGFAQKRREAELRANERAGRPARLAEIYDELRGELGGNTDRLMELELKLELDGCRPNPKRVEWFRQCVAAGKKVLLISDMYLSSEFLTQMLDKCGVQGYEKLYVSCEMGARKRDGTLFRAVLSELGLRPGQLVHIGDNRKGDFLRPLSMGIPAVWVRNDQKKLCKIPDSIPPEAALAHRTLQACIRNCSVGMTEYERMGCRIFGPLLYGFTQWLAGELRRDGIKDVYFLARDGYMMQRAFEELGLEGIKTHYLYCSRRSYQVPMIWMHSDFDSVAANFAPTGRMTLRGFLLRIGLEPENYSEPITKFGLNMDKVYEKGSFYGDDRIKEFYNSIRKDVEANSRVEYSALVSYLRSLNMQKEIAVVDIGYRGTMQNALIELLQAEKIDTSVRGYYVNTLSDSIYITSKKIDAKGYFVDRKTRGYFFEIQFLTPQGSTKRFVLEDGKGVPEFDEFEYADSKDKIVDELAIISEFQNGALELVRYMIDAFPIDTVEIPYESAMYEILRLENKPTLSEAELWGDFRFINYTREFYARPSSMWYYITHPKRLKKDFIMCSWKIGFLRRLFKVPLPYHKLYGLLRKVYGKI